MDNWPSSYGDPPSESQPPHPHLLAQRRMSIADSPSLTFASIDVSRNDRGASRRVSAPHIDSRDLPPDQGPSAGPSVGPSPSKPSKPPLNLKLYPWINRPDSPPPPPPRDTSDDMIKCPYPGNDCTETLPKNMITWRRHLANKHGLVKDTVPQMCQWPGCGMTMGGRSLNRHVLMKHMDLKLICPHCKGRRRYDHMDKHILNCPSHPAKGVR